MYFLITITVSQNSMSFFASLLFKNVRLSRTDALFSSLKLFLENPTILDF